MILRPADRVHSSQLTGSGRGPFISDLSPSAARFCGRVKSRLAVTVRQLPDIFTLPQPPRRLLAERVKEESRVPLRPPPEECRVFLNTDVTLRAPETADLAVGRGQHAKTRGICRILNEIAELINIHWTRSVNLNNRIFISAE